MAGEDGRHVARLTRMDAGGGATRAAAREGKQREEEEEADVWGPVEDFYFLFSFFFRAVTATEQKMNHTEAR